MSLTDMIGLSAPVLFLYAYAMLTLGRWSADSLRYHVLNFLGAIAILISLINHWNLPVFILEVAWGAISVYGIVKLLRADRPAGKRFVRRAAWGAALLLAVGALVLFLVGGKSFDRTRWDKANTNDHNDTTRCSMADDLIANHLRVGHTTKLQALALIGEEDATSSSDSACNNALTYGLGFCSLMDGHTLDLCFDANDVLVSARNAQH